MKLKNLVPMLNVTNLEQSLEFYQSALSFERTSPEEAVIEWRWAFIRSGDTELMLAETQHNPVLNKDLANVENEPWPTVLYFYPDDVRELHEHVLSKGYATTGLENTFYGMYEFGMKDPDGHSLSFGQDAEET